MKTFLSVSAIAALLVLAPSRSYALWGIAPVTKESAKEMGLEVRASAAGPKHVTVELEFPPEGRLKRFSNVELQFDAGDKPTLRTALREDRSKPGRVAVNFTVERSQLNKVTLWIRVPESAGGTIYEVRPKDFVELDKNR